jgi:hypothetical protein
MDERPPPPPSTPFREERWRRVGPSGKAVICTVEDVGRGYEVRVKRTDVALGALRSRGRICSVCSGLAGLCLGVSVEPC